MRGCQAVLGSSGSHERREPAPGLAGMVGTAEVHTAGPAACCQGDWQRNTDLSYWEPFNPQASPSISGALLSRLIFSIHPQRHISLMGGDAVSHAVVCSPARTPPDPGWPPTPPPRRPGKASQGRLSSPLCLEASAASLDTERSRLSL